MVIGLVSYEFINNDIDFNISQIEKAIKKSKNIDMLCFGETFLQGFDAFNWNYNDDKEIAISKDSNIMNKLEQLSLDNNIDLALGYLEKENDNLYSSYAIIINGKLTYNYRRISLGWKEETLTDYHYKEGNEVVEFKYKGHNVVIALCGDMWEYPLKFKSSDLLLWPVYVNFDLDEWKECEDEYASQALLACNNTLMVNSLSEEPKSYGGAFYFKDGRVIDKTQYDKEEILIVEI